MFPPCLFDYPVPLCFLCDKLVSWREELTVSDTERCHHKVSLERGWRVPSDPEIRKQVSAFIHLFCLFNDKLSLNRWLRDLRLLSNKSLIQVAKVKFIESHV